MEIQLEKGRKGNKSAYLQIGFGVEQIHLAWPHQPRNERRSCSYSFG
jgi:hypothetical protein